MADHAPIHSPAAAEPVGPYPHARRVGDLLFLSGVGPRKRGSPVVPGAEVDGEGKLIGWDIAEEMRSCFDNVRTILASAGSRWENIVDVMVFLTDMGRDWATYNRVYGEHFPTGPNQPSRTTVEVSQLPTGGNTPIHFEIKIVATI